jgi:hypothetical protein
MNGISAKDLNIKLEKARDIWLNVSKTNEPAKYTAEMSEIDGNEMTYQSGLITFVVTPIGGIPLKSFDAHKDREGDITHWSLETRGASFTIFND